MADDQAARVAETAEIRGVYTMDGRPTVRHSLLDTDLTTDTTPWGLRDPAIVPPADPPVATTDVSAPMVMRDADDE